MIKVGSIVVCIYDYANCKVTQRLKRDLGGVLFYPEKSDEIYYLVRQLDEHVDLKGTKLQPALLLEEIDNSHMIGEPVPFWMSQAGDKFGAEIRFCISSFREVISMLSIDELLKQTKAIGSL